MNRKNKIIVAGAGIGGCAAAIAFAQKGWDVIVIEKLHTIFTEGAGILLYSNALKSLDHLGVLDSVLHTGASMAGHTVFLDNNSIELGTVHYQSIDTKYPAYTGINRQSFLEILYNKALTLGVNFIFGTAIESCTEDDVLVVKTDKEDFECDLFVVANGTNSNIRRQLWKDSSSVYSGFGVWHSMHRLHPHVKEKTTVIMPDRRFGIIPISKSHMYIWASMVEPNKRWIDRNEQPTVMKAQYSGLTGFLKDIIDELDTDTYVHYTSVEEVTIDTAWHNGRVVLLGDAAHASLPFMAQGGAMAIQDAVVLAEEVDLNNLDQSLKNYMKRRKPVVDTVQQMCRNIGKTYSQSTVDIEKAQKGLDSFYGNKEFFN